VKVMLVTPKLMAKASRRKLGVGGVDDTTRADGKAPWAF